MMLKILTILRWVFFLPLSIVLLKALEYLLLTFIKWFYGDIKGFLILFLVGGLFYLVAAAYLFFFCCVKIINICPEPFIGSIATGTIYFIMQITVVVMHVLTHQDIPNSILFSFSAIVTMFIYALSAYDARENFYSSRSD